MELGAAAELLFFGFLVLSWLIGTVALPIVAWRRGSIGKATATVIVALGVVVVLPILFFATAIGGLTLTACRGEERATYEEFAQYSPRTPQELDPRPGFGYVFALGGNCHVVFDSAASNEEVVEYYVKNLNSRDWNVEIRKPRMPSETTRDRLPDTTRSLKSEDEDYTQIWATREQYLYLVTVSDESSVESPSGKVHVTASVRD